MVFELKIITAQEVADALRVSRATVTRLAQRGELVRIPIAGRLLFTQPAQYLRAWLAVVAKASDHYSKLMKALGDSLEWITRQTFPLRNEWPTLYTMRHLFAANAKDHYADVPNGLAIVAALLGHSSDATASHHYARRAGGSGPTPRANPNEVSLVRALFREKYDAFLAGTTVKMPSSRSVASLR